MRDRRRLAAVVSVDVVGYSRLMGRNESGTLALLKSHRRELIDPKIADSGGRIVKTLGDGLLLEFPSAVNAVRCAVDIQRGMATRNANQLSDQRIDFRIGVNVGDIIIDDDDIFGNGVNVAARLEGLAEPGGVCISRKVYDEVVNQIDATFEDNGLRYVKNIDQPIHVYGLARDRMSASVERAASASPAPESTRTYGGREYDAGALVRAGQTHQLPHPLTTFVGREADLIEYARTLERARLVTLTGAGGVGKTRLAVELAERVAPRFAHGVWFVDLAPLTDTDRVPLAVAMTLHLRERPGQPLIDTLREHLADQQLLLVLDNCEHLVKACADLSQTLLGSTLRLKILATSREALDLPGEQTLRVRSLSNPVADQGPLASLENFESVQLFVDRARLVQPDFSLNPTTAPAVVQICRRLDGIPLAIELAAAWTKVRSTSELRNMMDDRLRLLIGGSKAAPPRQQTLRATIEWSFALLTPDERQAMARLSIFAGGWTLDAAIAVVGEEAGQYETLQRLTRLLDKSLITSHSSEDRGTRYSMLETVRQYSAETLYAAGAETMMARRHLNYFVGLAEQLEPATTNEEVEAFQLLAPELENLLQALGACNRVSGGLELGLRLVGALGQYWMSLGLIELGYRVTTEALLRCSGDDSSAARIGARFNAARLAFLLGRNVEARHWANECLALARLLQDDHAVAGALALLGRASLEAGEVQQGIVLFHQALKLAREHVDCEQINRVLNGLGVAQEYLGNFEDAVPFYEEALQSLRLQRDSRARAITATNLASIYIVLGRVALAWPIALEALNVGSTTKSQSTMHVVLDTVTALASAVQNWHWGARMLGAVEAARNLTGHKRERDSEFNVSVASVIRKALTEPDFVTAYDAGRALTMEQAVEEAHAWLEKSEPPGQANKCGASSHELPDSYRPTRATGSHRS